MVRILSSCRLNTSVSVGVCYNRRSSWRSVVIIIHYWPPRYILHNTHQYQGVKALMNIMKFFFILFLVCNSNVHSRAIIDQVILNCKGICFSCKLLFQFCRAVTFSWSIFFQLWVSWSDRLPSVFAKKTMLTWHRIGMPNLFSGYVLFIIVVSHQS